MLRKATYYYSPEEGKKKPKNMAETEHMTELSEILIGREWYLF